MQQNTKSIPKKPPVKVNPYAIAIFNCLHPILQKTPKNESPVVDEATTQFLTNMVQGRLMQYLVARIAQHHKIEEAEIQKKLLMTLMDIFSDRFFAIFRENVRVHPQIVYKIAKRIVHNEVLCKRGECRRMDLLYLWIFRKYFEYQNVDGLLQIIEYNAEVRKIILISQLMNALPSNSIYQIFYNILQQDTEGIIVHLFSRYLKKNKIDRLIDLVQSGDWKIEANFIYQNLQKTPQCLIV